MFNVKGFAIEEDKYCHLSKSLIKEKEEKLILHVMYLMLPNNRSSSDDNKRRKKTMKRVQSYSSAMTTFLKSIRRHISNKRK